MEADDIDAAQLGDGHLALGVALHVGDVGEADHPVLADGYQFVHVGGFRGGIQGTVHFLEEGVIFLHIGEGILGSAQVRDPLGNLVGVIGEHSEHAVAHFRVRTAQETADLQDVGV